MSDLTKRQLTIRLSEPFSSYARNKPNVSRYIEGLVKQDYVMEIKHPIVKAVKLELMADEEFFSEVVERVIRKSRNY